MGIKFRCEHCGHKLNVKAFLAGKKGICPNCNARIQIPADAPDTPDSPATPLTTNFSVEEDDPVRPAVAGAATRMTVPTGPLRPGGGPGAGPVPGQPGGAVVRPAAATPTASPVMKPRTPAGPTLTTAAPLGVPVAGVPVAGGVAAAGEATGMAPRVVPAAVPYNPSTAMRDPISEAPQAIWYVRPSSGGQYGPAAGEIMRRWLIEGRVAADSLVWREGWPDWRQAGSIFPHLGGHAAPAVPAAAPQPEKEKVAVSSAAGSARIRSRKSSNSMVVALVVVLTLASLALLVALIVAIIVTSS